MQRHPCRKEWLLVVLVLGCAAPRPAPAATYYVSRSGGSDTNDGLSESAPYASLAKVNSLSLVAGDQVLLKCGDTWRAEHLVISKSGTEAAPIVFGSYPAGCAEKPILSGSRPVSGWTVYSGSIYRADLPAADFPMGINQLFRRGRRLTLGRWPNLVAAGGGYSSVDAHTAGGAQITDNELPAVNWTGARVHIKNIRWSMLEREVTGSSGHNLTLNAGLSCLISGWADCVGWGYFINHHLSTLDQDGEWYYDAGARRVYLYSTAGTPADVEASVVLEEAETLRHGGVMLSDGSATAYVILDNLAITNWFNYGISTPAGMNADIYHHITVRSVTIKDVDGAGVWLSSWLERPSNGRKGLRGGHHLTFTNDVIDGANHFGISGFFADSTFEGNTIRNIALIKNLGASGMGCGTTSGECTENGDGLRIRLYDVRDSGYGNTLRLNRFERTGYNAVDVFGPNTTIENNVITQACYSKADCGGVRTFGDTSLAATTVYNVRLIGNVIVDIPGNVDGCHPSRAAFGMGLYVDNYSRDVEVRGNTVAHTTIAGILLQRSTGQVVDNTVFNAASGTEYSAAIELGGDETRATVSGNVQYALNNEAWTLYSRSLSNFVSADNNYLFHPYVPSHIAYGPSWTRYTFAGWKSFSGREAHSQTNWFTQGAGEASRGSIFLNDTNAPVTIDLGGRSLVDLDQNPVTGSLTLDAFSSQVLVDTAPVMRALSVTRVGDGAGTVTSQPAGIACGLDCLDAFPQGTLVTLTATPIGTSSFAGWSGACTGVGPCVVDLASDAAVTARFDLDESVTIEDVSIVEGDSGTKTVVIKVKLSAPSTEPVTINWSTADPPPPAPTP